MFNSIEEVVEYCQSKDIEIFIEYGNKRNNISFKAHIFDMDNLESIFIYDLDTLLNYNFTNLKDDIKEVRMKKLREAIRELESLS